MLRILCTSVLALVLTIVPLPNVVAPARPDWLLLLVIYWCLAAPSLAGLAYAWFCGLLVDGLVGSLLGQHALAFSLVGLITHRLQLRMRIFPVWQQAFTVLLLLALYHFLVFWVDGIVGQPATSWWRWLPVAAGAIFWPVLVAIMDTLNRSLRR
jgi:rod shape-determining protein MreD